MKLNWFSPLPPARTDIAHFSERLAPALAAHADVTLWTHSLVWDRELENYCRCRTHNVALPWDEVNRADAGIYNIGNNAEFHAAIWEAARVHSGVVVLHDTALQDLYNGLFHGKSREPDEHIQLMQRLYGPDLGNVARRTLIDNALAVVVHTPGAFQALSTQCPAALAYLPLPYAPADPDTFARWEARRHKPVRPPFKVVAVGFMGMNRRLDSLFQALAELPVKDEFRLHLYGPVLDESHAQSQIRHHHIERLVTIHGYVPALDDALADADLAVNLRYPTMGEASGSQLRIWDHALPSIVTRTGWYATLPADAVLFVDMEREIEDLTRHLTAFVENPQTFVRMGENGRAALLRNHTPEKYARDFVQFVEQALAYRPALAFRKTAHRAAAGIQPWIGELRDPSAVDRIAAAVSGFCP